ncbi:MAG: protein-export chaperone SecB [Nitrospirota bacterium]
MGTNPGIQFVQVSLIELDFKLNKNFKLPDKGVPVDMGLDVKKSFSSDKKSLTTVLSAILFNKTTSYPFKMKVSVEGLFVSDNIKELQEFSKIHAPAHLMPFLREVIGTTTLKANIPPLLLPPFNISELLKEKRKG